MIYKRFRAGETTAKPAGTTVPRSATTGTGDRHMPSDRRHHGTIVSALSGGHDPAEQVILGRSLHRPAGVLRYPSTSLLRANPRLRICYTARNRTRSAKPATSLLTELFRPYTFA